MKRKINMVQYGCGNMSAYTMRYALEKGVKIVGAFDICPDKVGQDISVMTGGKNQKVLIQHADQFEAFLQNEKPDAVIVTTTSLLNEVAPIFLLCAQYGVNAISICEEALFPQNSNPKLFAQIDKLAKKNGCTISGTGYQDVFWGNLITVLAGATHQIKEIVGVSSYNVEDYGIALAKVHGAGLDVKTFNSEIAAADNVSAETRQALIEKGEFTPSYMWNVNGWIASQLGLTITEQVQKCVPQIAKGKLKSKTLGMEIPKGYCSGMSAVVTSQTKEGVVIKSECIGKVYDKKEFDKNDWTIVGEPTTQVTINKPNTVELTCATVVNRLPDLLNAPNGYVTTEKMPRNSYRNKKLDSYVQD